MKQANWKKIVYVKEAPLMLDGVALRHIRTDKILDGKVTLPSQSYLYLDGDIYYREKEVINYEKWIEKRIKNLNPIFNLVYRIADRFAKKESIFDPSKLKIKSNTAIIKIFEKYSYDYQNVLSTLYVPVPIDVVLSRNIKKYIETKFPDRITEIFNALTLLKKKHDIVKYHEELLGLALRGKILLKYLDALAKKYAFLGIKFYLGRPFNYGVCLKHLKEIKNPKQELGKKIAIKQRELKAYHNALRLLKPPKTVKRQIEWLQEAIYMRTYRLERISEGENNSFVLLAEISRRLNRNPFDLIYFRFYEIIHALKGELKITDREILRRKKPLGMESLNRKTRFYYGSDYLKFSKKFNFKTGTLTEIKGQVAFPGLVRGRVRIIRSDEEMHMIKKGEILVTRMTTPDYIFAMRTSAAIITDVGGVTSHASVVSRELAKPCIIGTGFATQLLKTGDLVEVNANKGIVRKI